MKFQQKDVDTRVWQTIAAGQQVEYAFEEPLLPHKLRVVLSAQNAFLDQTVHEYPLDIIKVSLLNLLYLGWL